MYACMNSSHLAPVYAELFSAGVALLSASIRFSYRIRFHRLATELDCKVYTLKSKDINRGIYSQCLRRRQTLEMEINKVLSKTRISPPRFV